jgi:hypothetical protein
MKKRTHLHTNFIKFILEKYNIEELSEEESNVSDEEIIDDIDTIETPDEVQDEDDETIEDLIKEYYQLEKKYKTLRK